MFEGTGIYFLLLFLVFLIVYVAVKVSLGVLFEKAKVQSWKAYVPFYSTLVLVDLLDLKRSVFYFTFIPFVNLYYYYVIIGRLLEGFGLNSKDAIWYIMFPMYQFPQLVFKNPKFVLNEYDLTEDFIETQNILFETPAEELPDKIELIDLNNVSNDALSERTNVSSQGINDNFTILNDDASTVDSVFVNQNLQPDESQVTYVEAPTKKEEEEKPIFVPLDEGRPKFCKNCGAKLSSSATTCFLCGHKLN